MNMLNQAEAAGMDPGMLASLRESLEGLRQSIEEDERAQSAAASAPVEEPAAPPPPVPANLEPNLAASTLRRLRSDRGQLPPGLACARQ